MMCHIQELERAQQLGGCPTEQELPEFPGLSWQRAGISSCFSPLPASQLQLEAVSVLNIPVSEGLWTKCGVRIEKRRATEP
jgi:hypothetical protein